MASNNSNQSGFNPLPLWSSPPEDVYTPEWRLAYLEPLLDDRKWEFQRVNILALIDLYKSG